MCNMYVYVYSCVCLYWCMRVSRSSLQLKANTEYIISLSLFSLRFLSINYVLSFVFLMCIGNTRVTRDARFEHFCCAIKRYLPLSSNAGRARLLNTRDRRYCVLITRAYTHAYARPAKSLFGCIPLL